MQKTFIFGTSLFLATVAFCSVASETPNERDSRAKNWNQFRGPRADGVSDAKNVPVEFGESKNVAWKTAIHGRGWSSPVVWGDQIWVATADEDGEKMYAVCVDAKSGKIVHDLLVFENEKVYFRHPTNSYASCTPYIEERRLYVHFGRYGTACLDTNTGKKLWERRDFESDDFRGPASSPIVFEDLLIVNFDGVDVQFVVAMNKDTGKTVWRKERTIDYETDVGDRKKAYGTPRVIEVDGRPQLVSPAAVATIAYEPRTGKEIWRVHHGGMNAGAPPLYEHGLVYIAAGSGDRSLVAVRPEGSGDVRIAWETGKGVPKRSAPVIVDDLMFMVSDNGVASCLDAKTGVQIWQKRLGGDYWASPVYAGGNLYFFNKEGKIPVVKASREFELAAENELESGFNASPAFVDDAMILRTFTHLYRVEKQQP